MAKFNGFSDGGGEYLSSDRERITTRKIYDLMTLHNSENLHRTGRSSVKIFRVSDGQWEREKFAF